MEIYPIPPEDAEILRRLGEQKAGIAALPVNRERTRLWQRLNDRESVRPMVWVHMYAVPWHEMNVDDELTIRCTHPFAVQLETTLRRELYQWRHMPADMIISPHVGCPKSWSSTRFGIKDEADIVESGNAGIVSRHFHRQIFGPEDLDKIRNAVVSCNAEETAWRYEQMQTVFKDVIPVRLQGVSHIFYTPWDHLVCWWGLQEAMMDLVLRPKMVNEAVSRMVDSYLAELDQLIEYNLLDAACLNSCVGSGGYGYTGDLPGDDYDPDKVMPQNMWGSANAQALSDVSPEMHWEFAVKHDLRWFEKWGVNYYGCCEALDRKHEVLKQIPNLRKVSVSPWSDPEQAAANLGNDYVLSRKPNPAVLAMDKWDGEAARRDIRKFLEAAKGCHVELIMKDISTVRNEPSRLWEWARIAMEEIVN